MRGVARSVGADVGAGVGIGVGVGVVAVGVGVPVGAGEGEPGGTADVEGVLDTVGPGEGTALSVGATVTAEDVVGGGLLVPGGPGEGEAAPGEPPNSAAEDDTSTASPAPTTIATRSESSGSTRTRRRERRPAPPGKLRAGTRAPLPAGRPMAPASIGASPIAGTPAVTASACWYRRQFGCASPRQYEAWNGPSIASDFPRFA
jgi:hypothetical protein